MRKFLVFVVIVTVAGMWVKNFVRSGKLDAFMDRHPRPEIYAPLEYCWGMSLEMASRTQSAEYRFRRIREKYPKTTFAPLAWVELINQRDDRNDREGVMTEGQQFLDAYPDHPKAEIIRKKMAIIEHGL